MIGLGCRLLARPVAGFGPEVLVPAPTTPADRLALAHRHVEDIRSNVDRMYRETDPALPADQRKRAHDAFSARNRLTWDVISADGLLGVVSAILRDDPADAEALAAEPLRVGVPS